MGRSLPNDKITIIKLLYGGCLDANSVRDTPIEQFMMGSKTETAASEDWRALVDAKQRQLDKQIPAAWRLDMTFMAKALENGRLLEENTAKRSGILTEDELDITENYSATELLTRLRSGQCTSVAVTAAFCKRAAIAQQLVSGALLAA